MGTFFDGYTDKIINFVSKKFTRINLSVCSAEYGRRRYQVSRGKVKIYFKL